MDCTVVDIEHIVVGTNFRPLVVVGSKLRTDPCGTDPHQLEGLPGQRFIERESGSLLHAGGDPCSLRPVSPPLSPPPPLTSDRCDPSRSTLSSHLSYTEMKFVRYVTKIRCCAQQTPVRLRYTSDPNWKASMFPTTLYRDEVTASILARYSGNGEVNAQR